MEKYKNISNEAIKYIGDRQTISNGVVISSIDLLENISLLFPNNEINPSIGEFGVGKDENRLLIAWDNSVDHLEFEIFPDGMIECFYLNRETDKKFSEYIKLGTKNYSTFGKIKLKKKIKDKLSLLIGEKK